MQHNIIVTDEGYSGLNPVQSGYQKCIPGHFFGPAVRDHYLIHFVVSGKGIYRIGEREYEVSEGEMFVIPPNEETFYQADKENPWSYIWIGFNADGGLPLKLKDVEKCPEAKGVFNSIKNADKTENGRSAYLSARLWDLFSVLLDKKDVRYDYVEMALDCIHSEYMNGITVEDIAKRLNLDRSYFYTIFKKRTGISPKKYLLNHRMNIAANLLKERKLSVSVAAYSVGYTDIFNFSKMFKKHFGVSPSKY